MSGVLPGGAVLATFAAASLLLALTPGPAVVYIVSRSLAQGRRAGLAAVAGIALGNLGNALGAALGLATLFAVSAAAFTVVKDLGALYLIYLGVRALRGGPLSRRAEAPPAHPWRGVGDAFVVALFNPKTTLFFAAFLPQFVTAGASLVAQSVALGALFVAIAATTDTLYAVAAGAAASLLARRHRLRSAGRYLSGGTFIGLGLLALAGGRRDALR